jgi:hypothetical protein
LTRVSQHLPLHNQATLFASHDLMLHSQATLFASHDFMLHNQATLSPTMTSCFTAACV